MPQPVRTMIARASRLTFLIVGPHGHSVIGGQLQGAPMRGPTKGSAALENSQFALAIWYVWSSYRGSTKRSNVSCPATPPTNPHACPQKSLPASVPTIPPVRLGPLLITSRHLSVTSVNNVPPSGAVKPLLAASALPALVPSISAAP